MHSAMIYLVRHGQTEFNAAGRHHGWVDSPLTDLGRVQARTVGHALARLVDGKSIAVFVSPLGRAMETARIISEEAGILTPAIVDRDLREIGMGSAEGLTESEMASVWPERQRTMRGERMSLEVPDGETLIELGKRLSYALSRIITTPVDAKVIVSHGVASRVLQALYLGKSPQDAANFNAPHDAIFQLHASGVLMLKC